MNRFGFSVTPIYRKTREVQFAAGGQHIAPTFPLIDARVFGFSPIGPPSEHHKKVHRSTKGSVQVQVQPAPRSAMFLDFHISEYRYYYFRKICLGKMLVGYRGIDNKGVLDRPWTIWKVLRAISSTLKCQFTGNHENEKI